MNHVAQSVVNTRCVYVISKSICQTLAERTNFCVRQYYIYIYGYHRTLPTTDNNSHLLSAAIQINHTISHWFTEPTQLIVTQKHTPTKRQTRTRQTHNQNPVNSVA